MPSISIICNSVAQTGQCATDMGEVLRGGEVLEFISDVGGGKTTFVKGLAIGLGISETVQSPTFTISRIYHGHDDIELHHFDFYRLKEAGVVAAELAESIGQPNAVVAVEWGDIVHDVLPDERITITIKNPSNATESRELQFAVPEQFAYVVQALQAYKESQA